jgi:hypothetical protein
VLTLLFLGVQRNIYSGKDQDENPQQEWQAGCIAKLKIASSHAEV